MLWRLTLAAGPVSAALLGLAVAHPGPGAADGPSGTVVEATVHRPSLEGNLAGDPARRPPSLYLPPSYAKEPHALRKKETITPAELELLMEHVRDEPFRDLLVASYDCGARPQEVKRLEARHVDLQLQRAVLPADETKGKHQPRTIYFPTDRTLKILERLMARHPEGPLFRNRRGNAWTGNAVKRRFEELDAVVGRRITQYMFRRTWITQRLIAGVDSHVVA
jgi:integrase